MRVRARQPETRLRMSRSLSEGVTYAFAYWILIARLTTPRHPFEDEKLTDNNSPLLEIAGWRYTPNNAVSV
jgi:hypothetical protein